MNMNHRSLAGWMFGRPMMFFIGQEFATPRYIFKVDRYPNFDLARVAPLPGSHNWHLCCGARGNCGGLGQYMDLFEKVYHGISVFAGDLMYLNVSK